MGKAITLYKIFTYYPDILSSTNSKTQTIDNGNVSYFITIYFIFIFIWRQVRRANHNGQITIEAGGVLSARNLIIDTDYLKVDKLGKLTVSGAGKYTGEGAGTSGAGGSFGGKGGKGNSGLWFAKI